MQTKWHLGLILLAFLSFFTVAAPHQAMATTSAASMDDCDAFNETVRNNRSSWAQSLFDTVQKIGSQFPVIDTMGKCFTGIVSLFSDLSALASPFMAIGKAIAAAVVSLIQNVISSICSQIGSIVSAATSAITTLAKICIPMPKFDINLEVGGFNATSCSGSVTVPMMSTSGGGWNGEPSVRMSDFVK